MLLQILAGQDSVFTELSAYCETWYHMLVSKMLYQRPTVIANDLQYYVQVSLSKTRTKLITIITVE